MAHPSYRSPLFALPNASTASVASYASDHSMNQSQQQIVSPLLPRELQLAVPNGNNHGQHGSSNANGGTVAPLLRTSAGSLQFASEPSPPSTHAPLTPFAAPGIPRAREFDHFARIYGWQNESASSSAQETLLAVNMTAAAKYGTYASPAPAPITHLAGGASQPPQHASAAGSTAGQKSEPAWARSLLQKLPGFTSKQRGIAVDTSRSATSSPTPGTPPASSALAAFANSLTKRGPTSAPVMPTTSSPLASTMRGGYPDRDDASFTSFSMPEASVAAAAAAALLAGPVGLGSMDHSAMTYESREVGGRPRAGSFGRTHDRRYSQPEEPSPGAATSTSPTVGHRHGHNSGARDPQELQGILVAGDGAIAGYPEHRRVSSDQSVRSFMIGSHHHQQQQHHHHYQSPPTPQSSSAAATGLRSALKTRDSGVAPALVPIEMIARSDSGYHGPELDSLGRSSTFSANAPPVPSIPATLRRQTDAEPPVGLPFAAYRLTQAPPASFDSMNGDEDEVMELDDDDAQEPGPDATMMSLGSPVGPAPSPSPMHGGAPGAQSADRRRMGFTPPPRTTSARTAAEAVAAATSAALVPTASSPPLGLEAEPGEFGMPPSGHPFWTNPRIFDAVTAASATRPMLGDMPSVVWEINPTDGTRRLMAACPVKLVEVLTTTLDYKFLTDFFLVYRCFMSPVQLGMLLILRFRWAMMKPDSEDHALVRFRTFIVLRHWISEYYVQDFAASRALRYLMIVSFINVIAEDPQVRANARDYRLVKTLKRLLRTEDQAYKHYKTMYTESGGDPRVPDALASWVYQVSVEKHFEPVYFPILSYVNAQSGGLARAGSAMASNPRDSGVDPTGSAASSLRDRDSAISAGGRPVSNATTALASSERKRHSRNGSESFVSGFFDAVSDRRLSGGGSSAASSPMVAAVASPGVSPSVVGAPASTMVANVPSALVALMSTSKSFLLAYKLDVIAEQFLLIEEMMLLSIPWPALISHSTMSGHSSAPGSPVQAMIDRFNATCQWVATEVCSQRSMDDRVKVIEKLIRLAVRSQILGNYSTVNAVTLGLQNPLVERLKKTWSKVSNVEKKQLRELITLTAPLKNWSALRAAQAGELERGSGIPFTGIVLSDLVFNREMSSELGKCRIDVVGQGQVALPVLNYHKFRVMAQAVDQFKAFQRTKRPPQGFGPELVPAYANCLLLRTVPNDELKRLSLECERK